MFYDSHAHLDCFTAQELEEEMQKCKSENIRVQKIVACASSVEANAQNLLIAKKYPSVIPALGIFPTKAIELNEKELSNAINFIEKNAVHAGAIGEVGLDFKECTSPEGQKKQEEFFIKMIEIAKKNSLPLSVHTRYAQSQAIKILQQEKAEKVCLHFFMESKKQMKQAQELGWFFGICSNVLYQEQAQKNISELELTSYLLETDAPMIFNHTKSVPSNIQLIAKKLAELRNEPLQKIEETQEKNFKKLFGV
jgi:TatD DNase family protein